MYTLYKVCNIMFFCEMKWKKNETFWPKLERRSARAVSRKIAALLYEISITDAADTSDWSEVSQRYNYKFCGPLARISFMALTQPPWTMSRPRWLAQATKTLFTLASSPSTWLNSLLLVTTTRIYATESKKK